MGEKEARSFPGKLILFGEHTVVHGGCALAIPTSQYSGEWITGGTQPFDTDFFSLIAYLRQEADTIQATLDLDRFAWDIDSGYIFQSNIPAGAGLGSSGALTAAIYHRYGSEYPKDIKGIKKDLALIEGYFHGHSSGLDPLISYLNRAVHIRPSTIEVTDTREPMTARFSLSDTHIPRDGKLMIRQYAIHWNQAAFKQQITENYLPMVDACIHAYLENDPAAMNKAMFNLSFFQLVHLNFLIPPGYVRRWEEQLMQSSGYFKICGAGGGGYLLRYEMNN